MRFLYLTSVTIHLLAAMLCARRYVLPGDRRGSRPAPGGACGAAIRAVSAAGDTLPGGGLDRHRRARGHGIASLAFRGILNLETLGSAAFWQRPYGQALVWKLALVAAMVSLAAVHDFVLGPRASRHARGSPEAGGARRSAAWLARANALLGVALVAVAVRLARGG